MQNNRFKTEARGASANMVVPIVSFVLIFGFFFYAISALSQNTASQQVKSLETAVTRDVLHCFAAEGEYPESIEYIEKNYALSYDHNKFDIQYTPSDGNSLPEIKVVEK
ncbi:MAG: hypothetical protein IKR68_01260 [Lachnospiraceae bacterium]|nr:hypothetical protein [Lachnospiraceae bacterium]